MFLMRLAPIIPYNVLNYLVGATSVSIKDNIYGYTGFIPMGIFNVYLGTQIKNLADITSGDQSTAEKVGKLAFMVAGILFILTIICIIIYKTK